MISSIFFGGDAVGLGRGLVVWGVADWCVGVERVAVGDRMRVGVIRVEKSFFSSSNSVFVDDSSFLVAESSLRVTESSFLVAESSFLVAERWLNKSLVWVGLNSLSCFVIWHRANWSIEI